MAQADNTWNRIDAAFQLALEKDGGREEWVRSEFADSPVIRDAVLKLLNDVERSETVIDQLIDSSERLIESAVKDTGESAVGMVGKRLGNFHVTDLIAAGGMGVVYKADRADGQWQQTVAIKILPSWAGDPATIARMRTERQILSQLQHPNIPPLLDGGETPDSYPYFVTEFIDGISITDYVEKHDFSVNKRLDLFCEIAGAVHYAHTQLIIHRDIKPANILVDENGRPHLLDFGIAKPIDADSDSEQTVQGYSPMTLQYASPEQLAGKSATTASDVYQLGLLLHRLLTGQNAIVHKNQRPQTAAAATTSKLLKGDLGVIVDTALRVDPASRYSSAAALVDDVRAYLRGAAIRARPETTFSTLQRLARRNPAGLGAAVLLLILLSGWLVSLQVYSNQLKAERDFATSQAMRAQRVKDVLTEIYRRQDPLQADPASERPQSMQESLDIAVAITDAELENEPDIQAELYRLFSALYSSIGDGDNAADLLARSARLLGDLGESALPDLAVTESELGNLWLDSDQVKSAAHYDRALELIPAIVGIAPDRAVAALTNVAKGANDAARRQEALGYYRRAIALYEKNDLDAPRLLMEILYGIGRTYVSEDRLNEAEPYLLEALDISQQEFGADHAQVSRVLNILSSLERNRSNLDLAIAYSNRAIAIMERDHPDDYHSLLSARNDLALALGKAGRYEESAAMLEEILSTRRQSNAEPGSLNLATGSKNLASILHLAGRYDEALDHAHEAQRLMELHLPPDSAYQAMPHFTKALIYLDSGRLQAGEEAARQSLGMLEPVLGENHYQIHVNRCVIGEALIKQGSVDDGLQIAVPALDALLDSETRVARYETRCRDAIELASLQQL